jgi:hypothetical protein
MFIFGIVVISSILMLFDNPLEDPNQFFFQVLYIINQVITGIFVLELMVKVIVYGLIANGESSYLKNGWNILDFVIVLTSILGLLVEHAEIVSGSSANKYLELFKMLRVLRSLRMITR